LYWTEASAAARDRIRTLHLLGLEQYRPFLLAALTHLQLKEVEALLRLLIGWNVRLLVVGGLGGGVMERHYSELGQAIRKGELKAVSEVSDKAKAFVPNDTTFRSAFASARISKVTLARYYLQALERQIRREKQPEMIPNTDPGQLTLEHVLPERPEKNWPQFSDEEAKTYVRRLGNMVLLKERMNSKLRSAPFEKKLTVYKKSELKLTKEVAAKKIWDKDAIERRQQKLAELALATWPLKS